MSNVVYTVHTKRGRIETESADLAEMHSRNGEKVTAEMGRSL